MSDSGPHWDIHVPGTLGPWTKVEIIGTRPDTDYEFTSATFILDGTSRNGIISVESDTYNAVYEQAVEQASTLILSIDGVSLEGSPYTNDATVIVTTLDGLKMRFVKRATSTFELSFTLYDNTDDPDSNSTVPDPTTYVSSDGLTSTGIVSFYPTTDSTGGFSTGTTIIPISIDTMTTTVPCETSIYTGGDGKTNTEIISKSIITESNGSIVTRATTALIVCSTKTNSDGTIETITQTITCDSGCNPHQGSEVSIPTDVPGTYSTHASRGTASGSISHGGSTTTSITTDSDHTPVSPPIATQNSHFSAMTTQSSISSTVASVVSTYEGMAAQVYAKRTLSAIFGLLLLSV